MTGISAALGEDPRWTPLPLCPNHVRALRAPPQKPQLAASSVTLQARRHGVPQSLDYRQTEFAPPATAGESHSARSQETEDFVLAYHGQFRPCGLHVPLRAEPNQPCQ